MHFPGNLFGYFLIISAFISIGLSWIVVKKLGAIARLYSPLVFAIGIWALGYGFELNCFSLKNILFWTNIEYIGIATLPALWVIFIINFIGKNSWLNPKIIALIYLEPVLTLFFKWSGFWNLIYLKTHLDSSGPFPMLLIEPGLWYKIHVVFFYSLLLFGLLLLISRYKFSQGIFKRQIELIVYGVVFPWLINITYLFHFRPLKQLDLTPFAFIITSFTIALGLLRYKLFDIVPIAREKIIEAMEEGVLVIDSQMRVVDLNTNMKFILGYKDEKWIGKFLYELFTEFKSLTRQDLISERNKKEISRNINGETNYFEITITPLYENRNIHSGNILLFINYTEKKINQQKLEELNQLKDRLFSIISHDLTSPLLNLKAMLNMVSDDLVTDEEFKSQMPAIAQNINSTYGLVENLLLWSKSQLAGVVINPIRFDIEPVIQTSLETYKHISLEKGINTKNTVNMETFVLCDKDMFQTVLRNLINNAIKFCRPGDTVKIGARPEGKYLVINISDTGVGISPENLTKLFTITEFTTRGTNNEKGTGLGLLLCKDFVEKNKGKIWVESKLNAGTTFYISLPI